MEVDSTDVAPKAETVTATKTEKEMRATLNSMALDIGDAQRAERERTGQLVSRTQPLGASLGASGSSGSSAPSAAAKCLPSPTGSTLSPPPHLGERLTTETAPEALVRKGRVEPPTEPTAKVRCIDVEV